MQTAPENLTEVDQANGVGGDPIGAEKDRKLTLRLEITDPEVIAELRRLNEGGERQRYALAALRVGVLCLRMASGHLDATTIREAGQKLVSDVGELLSTRAMEMTSDLASALRQYFDPATGAVAQRFRALLEKDGELDRVLRAHLGSDDSVLARTLAAHLGDGSVIFKMLSPSDGNGLRAQLAATLEGALREQRECVLREFSLDEPNSALSRLVSRVEAARGAIADQFSSENEHSALSRLSRLLENTSKQIGESLTLDKEESALSRLKRELQATINELVQKNTNFHTEVRETLASLQARKEEAARSTRHGGVFEEQLGELLSVESQRLGDVYEAIGMKTGAIKNCKIGDHITELGPDSSACGARIVWEAKEDRSYNIRRALAEIEEGRKNRQAQIGVFVFSTRTAPVQLQPFQRYGDDIVAVWDAEDSATDLYVRAAYSVARALAIRIHEESGDTEQAVQEIHSATRAVEKQLKYLSQFKTWGETVKRYGARIAQRADKMKKDLEKEVQRLDRQVATLQSRSQQP